MEAITTIRLLIANEPRAYRDVIGGALRALRPQVDTTVVEPAELDHTIAALDPDLVICSRLTRAVEVHSPTWILLYPDGKAQAVINMFGQQRVVVDMELSQILSTVDEAQRGSRKSYLE